VPLTLRDVRIDQFQVGPRVSHGWS
jgi:hypothetical protein